MKPYAVEHARWKLGEPIAGKYQVKVVYCCGDRKETAYKLKVDCNGWTKEINGDPMTISQNDNYYFNYIKPGVCEWLS